MTLEAPQYKYGDVVLVPFPFTNQAGSKQRPAVIISPDEYQSIRGDVIIMAITSQKKQQILQDGECYIDEKSAGLLKPSLLKAVVTTIEASLIIKKLGEFNEDNVRALSWLIRKILYARAEPSRFAIIPQKST